MSKRVVVLGGMLLLMLWYASNVSTIAHAETLSSPSYKFEESTLGTGGLNSSASANYQGTSSLGDQAVGDSSSANFNSSGGSRTTNDPNLAVSIDSANVGLGSFSSSVPSMATATFSVMNYTSYGYAVQIAGPPPTNNGRSIAAMTGDINTNASLSSPGFEQFGINVVANTSPQVIGANPNNGQFGLGAGYANYVKPNHFYYSDGAAIVGAPKSSGVTQYTISYLVNVANLTPGGKYTTNQTIVVTGTY